MDNIEEPKLSFDSWWYNDNGDLLDWWTGKTVIEMIREEEEKLREETEIDG